MFFVTLGSLEQSVYWFEASVCLPPFLSSPMATTVFSAFFFFLKVWMFCVCSKGFLAKCSHASRLLPAQMLRKTMSGFFPVITLISLVVLHISVESRKGEAWVCIDKTRIVMFTHLFHRDHLQSHYCNCLENYTNLFYISSCSILGKNTLRQGTKTDDAVCSNHVTQPATSQNATPALNLSTTDNNNNVSTAVFSPSRPSVIPFICPDTNSPTETNWGKERKWPSLVSLFTRAGQEFSPETDFIGNEITLFLRSHICILHSLSVRFSHRIPDFLLVCLAAGTFRL